VALRGVVEVSRMDGGCGKDKSDSYHEGPRRGLGAAASGPRQEGPRKFQAAPNLTEIKAVDGAGSTPRGGWCAPPRAQAGRADARRNLRRITRAIAGQGSTGRNPANPPWPGKRWRRMFYGRGRDESRDRTRESGRAIGLRRGMPTWLDARPRFIQQRCGSAVGSASSGHSAWDHDGG